MLILCLFLGIWTTLLWILYSKQQEIVAQDIIAHRQENINLISERLNWRAYISLSRLETLREKVEAFVEQDTLPKTYDHLNAILERETAEMNTYLRLRIIDPQGMTLVDSSNFALSGDIAGNELPWKSFSMEIMQHLEKGAFSVFGGFPQPIIRRGHEVNAILAHAYTGLFDSRDKLKGVLIMTFAFCACAEEDAVSDEMLVTSDGLLLKRKTATENGQTMNGFEVSAFAREHERHWDQINKGATLIDDFPETGGVCIIKKYQFDSRIGELWGPQFSNLDSDLELYILSPILKSDFGALDGWFSLRLLGIWLGISVISLLVYLLVLWKFDSESTARKALLDEREFQKSLLDAIPFPILYTDINGNLVGSNLVLKLGWCEGILKPGEVCDSCKGNTIGFCQKLRNSAKELLSSDQGQNETEFEHSTGGELKQYLIHTAKYRNHSGSNAGAIGLAVDISHFKEHEAKLADAKARADRANNAKSAFLATMSHEIRTPLNGIIGMSSLMADTSMDELQVEYVETIRASGETLLNLINDILDFSKIEADRIELESIPVDVEQIVGEVLDMLSKQAHLEDVDLIYRVDPDLKTEVIGDPVRLKQVITNLVSNAVKFTAKGSVIVSIEKDKLKKKHLRISVSDTGIGIHPDRIQSLFNPFVQEDSSTTRRFGGTGLGLAISNRLVKVMGGEMTVESEVGKGSIFTFDLPVGNLTDKKLPDNSQTRILPFLSVLAVDDNPHSLSVLTEMLEIWKMEVFGFTDAEKALQWLLAGNHCDVIISDHLMPEMDGETFCRKASSYLRSRNRLTPLLLMCSKEYQPDPNYVTKAVYKPLYRGRLGDALVHVLSRQPMGIPKIVSHQKRPEMSFSEQYPMRILIAEDNKVNQRVVKLILKKLGYEGDFVENGQQACNRYQETLESDPYDIVLMDIQMPIMDGIQAGRNIRAHEESSDLEHECCIIALSANVLDETRKEAMEVGFNDYLCKPVKVETLSASLEKAWTFMNRLSPEKRETVKGEFFTAGVPARSN